jgi:hypothetical protein
LVEFAENPGPAQSLGKLGRSRQVGHNLIPRCSYLFGFGFNHEGGVPQALQR